MSAAEAPRGEKTVSSAARVRRRMALLLGPAATERLEELARGRVGDQQRAGRLASGVGRNAGLGGGLCIDLAPAGIDGVDGCCDRAVGAAHDPQLAVGLL